MRVTPLRVLNENRRFFGLNMIDAAGLGVLFIIVDWLLMSTPYELLAFLTFILPLPVLIPIRMTMRRKIIRDSLFFFFLPRRVYDPKLVSRIESF